MQTTRNWQSRAEHQAACKLSFPEKQRDPFGFKFIINPFVNLAYFFARIELTFMAV